LHSGDKKSGNFFIPRRSYAVETGMTDQKNLVEKILAGDRSAFGTLIMEYQKLVNHIVFRMVPAGADREDICQEVFIKVYRNLPRFRFDSSLSTWIGTISRNTCLNFLDKKQVPLLDDILDEGSEFEASADPTQGPDRLLTSRETADILQHEIARLPEAYRTIVTLFHLDEMSYGEIGKIMKLPEGTVKSYLFRARRLMKKRLTAKYVREEL